MIQRFRRLLTQGTVVAPIAVVLLSFGLPNTAAAGDRGADRLIGTWRLVRYVDTPEGEAPIQAYGAAPVGLFIFTADGHVSINIMRNPPAVGIATTDPDPDACIPGWYCSYFGTYVVDRDKSVWVTHVLGGNIPAYLGTDQMRSFTIHGDRLVISETYLENSKRVRGERELVREAPGRR
jgi:Lipocalin-like domain